MSNTIQSPNIEVATTRTEIIPNLALSRLREILGQIENETMPVWPLKDYVAVNPHWKRIGQHFLDARQTLRRLSDFELLPSLADFRRQFAKGAIELDCMKAAVAASDWHLHFESAEEALGSIAGLIQKMDERPQMVDQAAGERNRDVQLYSQQLQTWTRIDWAEVIESEISKFCGSYFDEGQALWGTSRSAGLFSQWLSYSRVNRGPEIHGIKRFRKFVGLLPNDACIAILQILQSLNVPQQRWKEYLQAAVCSLPGWFAYARYQAESHGSEWSSNPFCDLLAIRLCFEVALSECHAFRVEWHPTDDHHSHFQGDHNSASRSQECFIRGVLLRAAELTWEKQLTFELSKSLSQQAQTAETSGTEDGNENLQRKLAQMVFCIDVRSERIRRHLEARDESIETFGFAGFFGAPMQIVPFDEDHGRHQLPVLLQPQFSVVEEPSGDEEEREKVVQRRRTTRALRSFCKKFATTSISCFTFVESLGGWFAAALLKRSLSGSFRIQKPALDGLGGKPDEKPGPTLRGLNRQGMTTSHQVDLAAGILKNLGLTSNFARLVVLCGHESQTENNPLAASLDCGACGGHSGAPNARFVALLLNQPYVRSGLSEQGVSIPEDTTFLAAVHNTTHDSINFFDTNSLPNSHREDLEKLTSNCRLASHETRMERAVELNATSERSLLKRAMDWSEVRPEWGLAGNSTFIVGPRSLTENLNLDGRAFLHSYESQRDSDGSVLELIMTAPMVVAHWINMQYFVSSVDPKHFGSGSKTLHNVVGKFGLLSGGDGDLMTGLPWESLHTGSDFQHQPLRLLSVIAAPRKKIQEVIDKHDFLESLLGNEWMHLICLEAGHMFRYASSGKWTEIEHFEEGNVHQLAQDAQQFQPARDSLRTPARAWHQQDPASLQRPQAKSASDDHHKA